MKKLLLIFATFSFIFNGKAFVSNLQLNTNSNNLVRVVMDGQIVAENANNPFISGIPEGNRSIQIFETNYFGNTVFQNIIYQGTVFIPGNLNITATVLNGQIVYNNIQAIQQQPVQQQFDNILPNIHQVQPIFNTGNHLGNQFQHQTICPTNGFNQPPVFQQGMNPRDFNALKNAINNQAFSSGKVNIAKQAIQSNYFTSQQMFQLVNLFDFNSDKLEIAKFGYTSTIDTQNYFVVYDAFDFNSSVNNLSAYIASL